MEERDLPNDIIFAVAEGPSLAIVAPVFSKSRRDPAVYEAFIPLYSVFEYPFVGGHCPVCREKSGGKKEN